MSNNNSMNGEIRQSIDNEDYYINIRTTADQVMYDNNISVKEKLAQMLDTINNISNNPDVVDKKIKEACNNLYIKIMGASDQSGLDEAYNTIKKISEYLINNQNVIDNLTEDVDDLKEDIKSVMHENKDVLDNLVDNVIARLEKVTKKHEEFRLYLVDTYIKPEY